LYRDHIIANKQAFYKEISCAIEIIEYIEKVIPYYKPTSKYFDNKDNPDVQIPELMFTMMIGLDDLMRIQKEIKREEKGKACNYLMGKFNENNEEFIDNIEVEEIEEHPVYKGYMNLVVRIGMFGDVEEYWKEFSIGHTIVSSILCELIAIDERSKVFDVDENDPPVEKIVLQLTVDFRRLQKYTKKKCLWILK
jgi:hypothetical protein